jgi:DNA processing protein
VTYLGLSDAQLAAQIAHVSPCVGAQSKQSGVQGGPAEDREGERTRVRSRFARGVLTALAEPGDSDAGALVAAIGPERALQATVERWDIPRVLGAVRESNTSTAELLEKRLASALERWRPRARLTAVIRAFESAARLGAVLVTPEDALWPDSLDDLGDGAPHALWVRGDPARLRELAGSIALVGARAATGYGEHVAMEASAGLGDRGFATVSGGAYGIDGAVHRASLASDATTIAFLAGGVDRLYPAGHSDLLRRVGERGLLIAELPCGSSPTKWRFLMRNRLIAAASAATVVVEAGRRSGSLNTAGHAASIGRPLGAVPGPVTSPASAGCHRLIREFGAECVTCAEDIAELAGAAPGHAAGEGEGGGGGRSDSAETVRLLDALATRTARPISELVVRSGMSTRDVLGALGALETAGRAAERDDGWVKTSPP